MAGDRQPNLTFRRLRALVRRDALNAFGLSCVRLAEKVARGQSNHIAALEANGRRDQAKKRRRHQVAVTRRANAAGEGQGGSQRNQNKHAEVKPDKPADQAGDAQPAIKTARLEAAFKRDNVLILGEAKSWPILAAIRHHSDSEEAQNHHGPGGGLWHGRRHKGSGVIPIHRWSINVARKAQGGDAIVTGRPECYYPAKVIEGLKRIRISSVEALIVIPIIHGDDGILAWTQNETRYRLERITTNLRVGSSAVEVNRGADQCPAQREDANVNTVSTDPAEVGQ